MQNFPLSCGCILAHIYYYCNNYKKYFLFFFEKYWLIYANHYEYDDEMNTLEVNCLYYWNSITMYIYNIYIYLKFLFVYCCYNTQFLIMNISAYIKMDTVVKFFLDCVSLFLMKKTKNRLKILTSWSLKKYSVFSLRNSLCYPSHLILFLNNINRMYFIRLYYYILLILKLFFINEFLVTLSRDNIPMIYLAIN